MSKASRVRTIFRAGLLSLVATLSTTTFADDRDSSSDADGGFSQALLAAKGVVIKVPVDELGRENTDAAELRLYDGDDTVSTSTNLKQVWGRSTVVARQPTVTSEDIARDSSTCGWYGGYGGGGYGSYYGYGWNSGYYNDWSPNYYSYGNYYNNYGSPYSYCNSGYSYYYYPSYYY